MDLLTEIEQLEKKCKINQNIILHADHALDELSSEEILEKASKIGLEAF